MTLGREKVVLGQTEDDGSCTVGVAGPRSTVPRGRLDVSRWESGVVGGRVRTVMGFRSPSVPTSPDRTNTERLTCVWVGPVLSWVRTDVETRCGLFRGPRPSLIFRPRL